MIEEQNYKVYNYELKVPTADGIKVKKVAIKRPVKKTTPYPKGISRELYEEIRADPEVVVNQLMKKYGLSRYIIHRIKFCDHIEPEWGIDC